ncbi:uncharacterized protein MYCFIDRAFT_87057 [Pseudocercospora fijiensis CIRAD86]|uniref:Uncharacterized protein n=1 Tax=Pseudocercospora fijiensis (strain CIRAD86) TaxID=383855 RepID=M3AXQ8_PSEFD|nr:uncharacterized protein MYCFIDRAFT_87057 [Pseudocercospora fijiensis CIRAD86]EME81898.1 hypothetical protein MYCFIDRAFT_87057 [Pseudocercospora fijiensis CIRAD86]
MLTSRLALCVAYLRFVAAQDWRDYNSLCDDTFDKANASSVYTYAPDLRTITSRPAPVSWAYTVYHNASTLQAVWWYNTGGANYSDDFGMGYDVCAFRLRNLTSLATWNAYIKNDDGSCNKTLDDDCIKDLKKLARRTAIAQVGEASPASNLTEGALPKVCSAIGTTILNNLPKTCKKYFDERDFEVATWQMSDYNKTSRDVACCSDIQYNSCPIYANESQATSTNLEITGSPDDPTTAMMKDSERYPGSWHAWWGLDMKLGLERKGGFNTDNYDAYAHGVFPMLTVYMSLANQRRQIYIEPFAQLTCMRATNFSEGSRKPPPLHPSESSSGLSPGAIGGIAAGSAVGALAVIIAAFLYYRHKRLTAAAARKAASLSSSGTGPTELGGDGPAAELDKGNEVFEKEGNLPGMEMDANAKKIFEMQGDEGTGTRSEMAGDTIQSELESPSGEGLEEKKRLELLEKERGMVEQPEVAELMGSEPIQRQSWTPSIRLVENVDQHQGEMREIDRTRDAVEEEDPPRI